MVYVVKQNVHGKAYYYLRKSVREDGKVKSKNVAYLGKDRDEALKKAREITEGMNKEPTVFSLEPLRLSVEELASFCKRKGFVYPSGEIYGGLSGFWDFGVLGRSLKENLKRAWWQFHVRSRDDLVGIDGAIITHPSVWSASGHLEHFTDYMVKNKKTKEVFKVDKLELDEYRDEAKYEIVGEFRPMFATQVGPYSDEHSRAFLRPETAQLMFTNFKLVQENNRLKLPFGVAQVGKSFRNEIAPREFLFRSREFEQMEIEYFIKEGMACPYAIPDVVVTILDSSKTEHVMSLSQAFAKKIIGLDWHAYWLGQELLFFQTFGCDLSHFRIRQHTKEELAHYSSDCWDIEYNFPFGWRELEGIADRGTHDLRVHEKASKKDLSIFDEETKEKVLARVVAEPSLGVERAFLVFLFEAMKKNAKGETVLSLHPQLSSVKAAVFPIIKKPEYEEIASRIVQELRKEFDVNYDRSGSIGRRYARNDEIGTPYCITIDDKTPETTDVTIRDRDTTKQIRVKIKNLRDTLRTLIEGEVSFEKAGKVVR